jgi:hypothetical protein
MSGNKTTIVEPPDLDVKAKAATNPGEEGEKEKTFSYDYRCVLTFLSFLNVVVIGRSIRKTPIMVHPIQVSVNN